MDILNSNWLIKMLEKSSQTPHGRLLSLFDILEDWLDAPNVAQSIQEQLNGQFSKPENAKILQDYLNTEAAKAGAAMPEMLANQLCFMAISAIETTLQTNLHAGLSQEDSSHCAFNHAKRAANALILAQTKKEFHIAKNSVYAVAASFLCVLIIAGSWFAMRDKPTALAQTSHTTKLIATAMAGPQLSASPDSTAALMAEIELMRHGNCQLIEAIQLPDNIKGIYINMVVHGQVSTDPNEQKIAMELLKKTRCNYTPMLMANSTG